MKVIYRRVAPDSREWERIGEIADDGTISFDPLVSLKDAAQQLAAISKAREGIKAVAFGLEGDPSASDFEVGR